MPESLQSETQFETADIHLQRLLTEGVEDPWYKSLLQNR